MRTHITFLSRNDWKRSGAAIQSAQQLSIATINGALNCPSDTMLDNPATPLQAGETLCMMFQDRSGKVWLQVQAKVTSNGEGLIARW